MTCECDPPPPLELHQGATWRWAFELSDESDTPTDLTGCSALLSFRDTPSSVTAWLNASTANGLLVIDGPAGRVSAEIPAATLAAISPRTGVALLNITFSDGAVYPAATFVARLNGRKTA